LHESLVQTTPSSQLGAWPGTHSPVPESHVSTPLQALPSSQSVSRLQQLAIGVNVQPPVGSQPSSVQASPSAERDALRRRRTAYPPRDPDAFPQPCPEMRPHGLVVAAAALLAFMTAAVARRL